MFFRPNIYTLHLFYIKLSNIMLNSQVQFKNNYSIKLLKTVNDQEMNFIDFFEGMISNQDFCLCLL